MSELGFRHEAVEYFEQRVDNRLSKCIGCLCNFLVGHVACGKGEIAALAGHDRTGSLDAHCAKSDRFSIAMGSEGRASSDIYGFF